MIKMIKIWSDDFHNALGNHCWGRKNWIDSNKLSIFEISIENMHLWYCLNNLQIFFPVEVLKDDNIPRMNAKLETTQDQELKIPKLFEFLSKFLHGLLWRDFVLAGLVVLLAGEWSWWCISPAWKIHLPTLI